MRDSNPRGAINPYLVSSEAPSASSANSPVIFYSDSWPRFLSYRHCTPFGYFVALFQNLSKGLAKAPRAFSLSQLSSLHIYDAFGGRRESKPLCSPFAQLRHPSISVPHHDTTFKRGVLMSEGEFLDVGKARARKRAGCFVERCAGRRDVIEKNERCFGRNIHFRYFKCVMQVSETLAARKR